MSDFHADSQAGSHGAAATDLALQRARDLISLGRYEQALTHLGTVLAAEPDDPEAHGLVAACRLGLDDAEGALVAGNQVVRCAPDEEWGHRLCSLALDRMGRHDEAVRAASEAVRLAPLDWRTHEALASAAVDARGMGRLARAAADRAVQLGPGEPSCHFVLGLVAQRFKDDDTARAAYRRTLAIDPEHATAINNLTVLDGGLRLSRQARGYGAVLRHEPGSEAALQNVRGLAIRFVRRLYYASIIALVVGLIASVHDVGTPDFSSDVTPVTVSVGVALLVGVGAYSWSLLRAIPAGVRTHVRSQVRVDGLLLANLVLTAAMMGLALVVCFVPGGAAVGLASLRVVGLLNVALFVSTMVRRR